MADAHSPIRIPISNVLLGDDYTGALYVGAQRREVQLLLDTGSSTFAVDHKSYDPEDDPSAETTHLVQEVGYADGSHWIGSVVQTDVTVDRGRAAIDLPRVNVAVAYHESAQMFGKSQGILGLAYKSLDEAYDVGRKTVPPKYSPNDVRAAHRTLVQPYFTQLARSGRIANKFAFYTRRSVVHARARPEHDPLNRGWLVLGGGEESHDLYTGSFASAKVLSDDWYSVNLKRVRVGQSGTIDVKPPTRQSQARTNAIVDSGTGGLDLAPALFDAILAKLPPMQVQLVRSRQVSTALIDLDRWPTLAFTLQGMDGDIELEVPPAQYWQMDGWEKGTAVCGLWRGDDQQSILGLPLMNGYFTVFDNAANDGLGVVKFARAR